MEDKQSELVEKIKNTQQSNSRRYSKLIYSTKVGFVDRWFEKMLYLAEKYLPTRNQNYHLADEN